MQLHNQGHRIIRIPGQPYEDSYYWVSSSPNDVEQTPIKLRFQGVAHHNAQATLDPPLRAAAS
jgi:hypothetical protein